ncbi:MAG: endonuclease III domain-containing protein [Candidatus Omnitrophota bacterium]|nr:MAG: endonuclease III domain-containing protein [Candidatus Omnitrophota bacterium]
MRRQLQLIYKILYSHFGPQRWWPAESAFEVMVGAILTQNTNWGNVSRAIDNLRQNKLITPNKLYKLPQERLALLIRPTGYYNIKAKRLREFLRFFLKNYKGSISRISRERIWRLREFLLAIKGIGPETADSIMLYALNKPVFVIDTYTKRILLRHGFISPDFGYAEVQNLFMKNLKPQAGLFNEFHALLVRLAKEYCLKDNPKCHSCPLKGILRA